MAKELVAGTYAFSPRYRRQILDLAYHREPGFPSFVTLQLRPTSKRGEVVTSTIWYVGGVAGSGRDIARYHIQAEDSGKVLSAVMDETQPTLEIKGE